MNEPIMTMRRKGGIMRTSGGTTCPTDPAFRMKVATLAEVLRGSDVQDHESLAEAALLFLCETPEALLSTRRGAVFMPEPEPRPYGS